MKFSARAIINAPAQQIFAVLKNSHNYPKFDPNCIKIEGDIALNKQLKIYSKLAPGRAFKVKVSKISNNEIMVWSSNLPLKLFLSQRTFQLIAKDDCTTQIILSEEFSGPLLWIFKKVIPNLNPAFKEFVIGLKHFVEDRP